MPMKSVFLALSLVSTLAVPAAMANERYRERPPVVVSPDLSAPWVTQLGGRGNVRPVVYPRAPAARQPLFQQRQVAMPQRPSSGVTSQRPARVQNAAVRPNAPVRTQIAPQFLPQIVSYQTAEKPGTIVIDTPNRFLYLVLADGKARRYGVGVGKPGFEWAGTHKVTRKVKDEISREFHNAPMPYSVYFTNTGVAFHAGRVDWLSHGCIHLNHDDAVTYFNSLKPGDVVFVY